MLVSQDWLKEYVDFDYTPEELSLRLNNAGLEVESIAVQEVNNVQVGEVLSVEPHPNADRLVVCSVNTGRPLNIVCGATNMKAGDKVVVAEPGARLPNGLTVKKAKLRGVVSEGMMCSEKELGVGEDHSGILILPGDAPVGQNADSVLKLNDAVFDLYVTPNRSDCSSVVGVAREVAVMTGNPLKMPSCDVTEEGDDINQLTSIEVLDPQGCPRYCARIVRDVTVGPSPLWLAERLLKAGLRPINNVVDATNYVLMELGHPLHAFDYDQLRENRIIVRRAVDGEEVVTLDGVARRLTSTVLVIADARRVVGLAGIMGAQNTEVTETTTNILLESAYFDPLITRRGARSLGLSTEASYRFERGADPDMAPRALDRAAQLIKELAGGKVARGLIDVYPRKMTTPFIQLRPKRVEKILGARVSTEEILRTLVSLGFSVEGEDETLSVAVPSFRSDVYREIDLIEEIGRIHGYDQLPTTLPTFAPIPPNPLEASTLQERLTELLVSLGMTEVINFSFGSPEQVAKLNVGSESRLRHMVQIMNPWSEQQCAMRTSLVPAVLTNVSENIKRGNHDQWIFELDKVFFKREAHELPSEELSLVGTLAGQSQRGRWNIPPRKVTFFDAKGIVETLLEKSGISGYNFSACESPTYCPRACAELKIGARSYGMVGRVDPKVLRNFDIKDDVFMFELDIEGLTPLVNEEIVFKEFSRFPPSLRDIAVIVSQDIAADQITSTIRQLGGTVLSEVRLFDVYKGPQVPKAHKSMAYSLRFQAPDRTLTDQEVNSTLENILKELSERFKARLRE